MVAVHVGVMGKRRRDGQAKKAIGASGVDDVSQEDDAGEVEDEGDEEDENQKQVRPLTMPFAPRAAFTIHRIIELHYM